MRAVSTLSSTSIEVAPRWSLPPPIFACDAKTRSSAMRSCPISASMACAASMSTSSDVRLQVGELVFADETRGRLRLRERDPKACRHMRRFVSSEKSARISRRP